VKGQGYLTGNQTVTLTGDISGSGTTSIATTLPTVNSNVGTFQGITVNGKGQVTAAVSQVGTANPLMDSTAAVGTSLLYARQDHVHPTDTSRASNTVFVASGASHAQGLVPDPGATAGTTRFLREDATWQVAGGGSGVYVSDTPPTGVADDSLWWESDSGNLYIQYNDGTSVQWVLVASPIPPATPAPTTGGFVNKFRNASMDVWQRGTSFSLTASTSNTGVYSVDGWMMGWTASASAAPAIAQAAGRQTLFSLQGTGNTNITDIFFKQRIESYMAVALQSQQVTAQAQIFNNTGGSITPTLTVKHAGTQDVWTSPVTDVSAVSLQACANGVWTQVAYSFAVSASAGLGLEITFDFGNNFSTNAKSVRMSECDIRVTPGIATGLVSNPPIPELRDIAFESLLNGRYLQIFNTIGDWGNASSNSMSTGRLFPTMRASLPTLSVSGYSPAPTNTNNLGSAGNAFDLQWVGSIGAGAAANGILTANAEL
jgi:hypothetical protein